MLFPMYTLVCRRLEQASVCLDVSKYYLLEKFEKVFLKDGLKKSYMKCNNVLNSELKSVEMADELRTVLLYTGSDGIYRIVHLQRRKYAHLDSLPTNFRV